ncbi:MAG: hypothetical protein R2752_00115 [Vicinamibacterales bacterium]
MPLGGFLDSGVSMVSGSLWAMNGSIAALALATPAAPESAVVAAAPTVVPAAAVEVEESSLLPARGGRRDQAGHGAGGEDPADPRQMHV